MINKTRIMHSMHSGHIIHIDSGHFDIDLMKLKDFLIQNWLNTALVLLLIYVVFTKDIHFAVHLNDDTPQLASNISQSQMSRNPKQKVANQKLVAASMLSSLEENDHNGDGIVELLPARPMKVVKPIAQNNEANLFDNVSIFVNPNKSDPSVLKSKKEKCWDYVTRFINIARTERKKFGIPVSITLAQGLLESDAGQSRLTTKANNHFGIKTFNKKVAHVVMKDDTPKDKFKIYNSAWESYRDHSLLLMRDHYKHLQFLSKTDYAGWAKGLEKAGYATDRQYAENLIRIIENLQLYRFDEA
jgi:flagellum-specific peptidoglycan hydrolase FlgJ